MQQFPPVAPVPPQPPRPPLFPPPPRPSAGAEVDVADPTHCMWRRSAALVVDAAVVTGVVVAAYWAFGVAYVDLDGRVVLPRGWLALAGLWGAWVVYWSVCEALPAHATPGKALCGVRVVNGDGSPDPGVGSVLVRNLMRIPDVFLCAPAGLLTALLSVGRRRPGDMVARTLVVHRAAAGHIAREVSTPDRRGDARGRHAPMSSCSTSLTHVAGHP